MSDPHAAPADQPKELFSSVELREFDAADTEAGRAIGKMLCILFIYTVIAMSVVSAWTAAVSS